jgi:hypothetical protein
MGAGVTRGTPAGHTRPQTPLRLGVDCQPFYIPKCANRRCRAPLSDSDGNPRWDIINGLFVCLRGCVQRPTRKVKT